MGFTWFFPKMRCMNTLPRLKVSRGKIFTHVSLEEFCSLAVKEAAFLCSIIKQILHEF